MTYNGHGYDDHILDVAFKGLYCDDIWNHGDQIIKSQGRRNSPFLEWGERKRGYPLSIDLAQVLLFQGRFPSLKSLGNRFGYKHLQTLPIAPGTVLTEQQKREIDSYNIHDLDITRLVLQKLDEAIEMRRVLSGVYDVNLTSCWNAKLGSAILEAAYVKAANDRARQDWNPEDGEPPQYRLERPKKQEWLCGGSDILSKRHTFTHPNLIALHQQIKAWTLKWRRYTDADGEVQVDTPSLGTRVVLADKTYSFMLGGVHSEDDPLIIESTADHGIIDIDVGSFYPGLIRSEQIAPAHLDRDIYLSVYNDLTQRRLAAKKAGHKEVAQGLKIAINAVYGKLSDRYSKFCDPPKGAAVTINGQLILLKLIEGLLSIDGLRVLSANTDGVTLHYRRSDLPKIRAIMQEIAAIYDLNAFDELDVIRICRASINEYVMAYRDEDGVVKIKARGGAFNDGTKTENLNKKTVWRVVKQAAIQCLLFDKPVADTIRACRDITDFLDYATLDDAWSHIEDDAGNRLRQTTNRWYEATEGTTLYKIGMDGKRNRFAKMQKVVVVNDLPDVLPSDVNFDFYIEEANRVVDAVVNPKKKAVKRSKSFDKLSSDEREELESRQMAEDADVEYLTSLDLNYYRDLYLGKHKLNFYDSMKSVLARLWNHRDLRLTRADLIWACNSLDSGQGYFNRRDKRRSILSFIDHLVDNAVPFEKEVFPTDEAPISVHVNVLDDEPGGGKTRYKLRQIVTGGPRIYWWAINKIDPIASERHDELMAQAKAVDVKVDFLPIHSKANGRGTMKMQIDRRMKEINDHPLKDETIFVTLITHKTLIDHFLRNVSGVILIDEPAEVWEQQHFDFRKSYRTIRELLVPLDAAEDYDGDVNPIITADTQAVRFVLTDEGKQQVQDDLMKRDTIFSSYRWIIEQAHKTSGRVFALTEQWNALDDPDTGGDLNVIALLHPTHIAHFDECWMMSAHFKELLIYKMWNDLYDVEWQFHAIEDGWKRKVPLRDRVTLYYVLEHRQVSDTYLLNKGDPKRRRAMARAVAEFYHDDPYIWSVNQSFKDTGSYGCLPTDVIGVDGERHDAYLTPKANGINCYQNLHGAAWLGSLKLSQTLLDILSRVWGSEEARQMALCEYELYACLQFLARANSRRFDSYAEVRYIVADKVQAEYIARMWNLPKDRVLPLPMDEAIRADLDDVRSKGTGRRSILTDEQKAERDRERKVKARAAKAEACGRQAGKNGRPKKVK